jgi:hypothetical protein
MKLMGHLPATAVSGTDLATDEPQSRGFMPEIASRFDYATGADPHRAVLQASSAVALHKPVMSTGPSGPHCRRLSRALLRRT